jgi:hypothetical protein
MTKIIRQARTAPPSDSQRVPGWLGKSSELVEGAVVEIVRVAVPAPALVMLIGFVEPKLKEGG